MTYRAVVPRRRLTSEPREQSVRIELSHDTARRLAVTAAHARVSSVELARWAVLEMLERLDDGRETLPNRQGDADDD